MKTADARVLGQEAGDQFARHLDRFEQERADFHERVRQAYLDRAQHFAQRMRVINASRSLPEIQKSLEEIIKTI